MARAIAPGRWLLVAVACAGGCAKEIEDPRSTQVNFTDPKSVTASIFEAAATGQTDHLAALCDPLGQGDEDTRRICAMTPDARDFASFCRAFARARLNGEPRVSGDRAQLSFVFGPDAATGETMELVRRNGRWYLSSF